MAVTYLSSNTFSSSITEKSKTLNLGVIGCDTILIIVVSGDPNANIISLSDALSNIYSFYVHEKKPGMVIWVAIATGVTPGFFSTTNISLQFDVPVYYSFSAYSFSGVDTVSPTYQHSMDMPSTTTTVNVLDVNDLVLVFYVSQQGTSITNISSNQTNIYDNMGGYPISTASTYVFPPLFGDNVVSATISGGHALNKGVLAIPLKSAIQSPSKRVFITHMATWISD